jgi:hypothetical protein
MNIISNTLGYTETHLIHVVAYDAAGNSVESSKVQIFVVHKEEEKEEGEAEPTAMTVGREVAYLGEEEKWRIFWSRTTMALMRQGC